MNTGNKILMALFVFSLLLSVVQSAYPFKLDTTTGFNIRPPLIDYLQTGQDYEFAIHLLNATNGVAITTASCNMHLYDSKGNHLVDLTDATTSNTYDYGFFVNGSNFTAGHYFANFYCNNTEMGQAGDEAIQFEVTDTGNAPPTDTSFTFFIIFFIVLMAILIYSFITGMGHLLNTDYDFIDLSTAIGTYFGLFAYEVLQRTYLNNPFISNIMEFIVIVGAFTHFLLPFIFLGISMIINNFRVQKEKEGVI